MLKYVNAMNRSIYAFELTDPPDGHSTSTAIPDGGGDRVIDSEFCKNSTTNSEEVGTCLICLEECDGELKKHSENNCNFIMCDPCVEVRCHSIFIIFIFNKWYFFLINAAHQCPQIYEVLNIFHHYRSI